MLGGRRPLTRGGAGGEGTLAGLHEVARGVQMTN